MTSQYDTGAALTEADLEARCILWVKKKNRIDPELLIAYGLQDKEKAYFGHPVLVLPNPKPDAVYVFTLTSRNIREQDPFNLQCQWSRRVSIRRDDTGALHLDHKSSLLRKDSWVRVETPEKLHISMLRRYDQEHNVKAYRLTKKSMQHLRQVCQTHAIDIYRLGHAPQVIRPIQKEAEKAIDKPTTPNPISVATSLRPGTSIHERALQDHIFSLNASQVQPTSPLEESTPLLSCSPASPDSYSQRHLPYSPRTPQSHSQASHRGHLLPAPALTPDTKSRTARTGKKCRRGALHVFHALHSFPWTTFLSYILLSLFICLVAYVGFQLLRTVLGSAMLGFRRLATWVARAFRGVARWI